MPAPELLATVWRGDAQEVAVRGHVAVVDAAGALLSAIGDPHHVTPLRSCVKPIQALPFVERAAGPLSAGPADLAIACASHMGAPVHVGAVRRLLGRAGLDDSALECGPQLPFDAATADALLAAGGGPAPIYNNCSGKHAAMLATCVVAGWPVRGYLDAAHPCQLAVAGALARLLDRDLTVAPRGIDGCGLPTYGVPLTALARAFAAGQRDAGFARCQDAMAAHPDLVAGSGRFDTALLTDFGARLTAKIGGAAVWVASIRPRGPGIAIKLEAGIADALPPVAIAVLQRLGVLPASLPGSLRDHARPALRNWAGTVVGSTRVEQRALDALQPLTPQIPDRDAL